MVDIKIRVFKSDKAQPETTVTIPGIIIEVASKLIPKQAAAALQDEGIDLDELIKLSRNPEVKGTIVEVEKHDENKKIVVSLE